MKGKTFPRKILCLSDNIQHASMSDTIKSIGNNACIEGLKKAIKANRPYHGKYYSFI